MVCLGMQSVDRAFCDRRPDKEFWRNRRNAEAGSERPPTASSWAESILSGGRVAVVVVVLVFCDIEDGPGMEL